MLNGTLLASLKTGQPHTLHLVYQKDDCLYVLSTSGHKLECRRPSESVDVIFLKSFYPRPIPGIGDYKFGFEIHYTGVTFERVYQFYGKAEVEIQTWIKSISPYAG